MTNEPDFQFHTTACHRIKACSHGGGYSRHRRGWSGARLLCPLITSREAWSGEDLAKPLATRKHMPNRLKLLIVNMANFQIHYWWLVIVSLLIHRLPFFLYSPTEAVTFKKAAMIISYLILFFVLVRNWKIVGFRILLVGALLNFAAIAFNGGLMPVTPEARLSAGMSSIGRSAIGGVLPEGSGILLNSDQTKLWLLTDIVPIDKLGAVCSIGDIIMLVGMIVLLIQIIYRAYPRQHFKAFDPMESKKIDDRERT